METPTGTVQADGAVIADVRKQTMTAKRVTFTLTKEPNKAPATTTAVAPRATP